MMDFDVLPLWGRPCLHTRENDDRKLQPLRFMDAHHVQRFQGLLRQTTLRLFRRFGDPVGQDPDKSGKRQRRVGDQFFRHATDLPEIRHRLLAMGGCGGQLENRQPVKN